MQTKDIGKYIVYSDGRVWSKSKLKFLKITICKEYPTVTINGGKISLHRLLGKLFIPNPKNLPQINHKNGNKLDFAISNLEWCTGSYNTQHGFDNGLIPRGEKHHNSILTKEEVYKIKYELSNLSKWKLAEIFNCSHTSIQRIRAGKTWKHI